MTSSSSSSSSPPPLERQFACEACGAKLVFDPSKRMLECPYCGHTQAIADTSGEALELDFKEALAKQAGIQTPIAGRSTEIRCPGCGAMVLLEDKVHTDECPFCTTHLENLKPEAAHNQITPHYVLPFAIGRREAIEAFNQWIASRWFAPTSLRKLANIGKLSGVYEPYWTYDAMTYSHYTGERGTDYWVTESYTTTVNGKSVRRTRRVRKTRWQYVSGNVDHFFNDVLVYASKSLEYTLVAELEPWDLPKLESFQPQFLAGFRTERYTVPLDQGFDIAKKIMEDGIRQLCRKDIGGDHQRISTLQTRHDKMTFKHLLLPLWLATYQYHGKVFHILVNARTAEVNGTRPYSIWKITLAVLLGLIVVGIIVFIFAKYGEFNL